MKKNKKAQVSTEIIFSVGIILLFFMFMMYYSYEKKDQRIDTYEKILDRKDSIKIMVNTLGTKITESKKNITVYRNSSINNNLQIIEVNNYPYAMPFKNILTESNTFSGEITINENKI